MPPSKIENVGQLREFVANLMLGVKNRQIEGDEARNIVNLAKVINESFYAEVKVAKIRFDASGEKFRGLGQMPINTDNVVDVSLATAVRLVESGKHTLASAAKEQNVKLEDLRAEMDARKA